MKLNLNYARGLTLTSDVYSNESFLLLVPSGKTLTEDMIEKLKKHGVSKVDVDVTEVPSICSKELEVDALKAISSVNLNEIAAIASTFEMMDQIIEEIPIDMSKYIETEESVVSPLILNVNSIIPALKIAKAYNRTVNKNDQLSLRDVALAVMCQDIGYICSNNPIYLNSIIARFGTNYEELRMKYPELKQEYFENYVKGAHPIYGYYLLKNENMGDIAETAVLLSAENYKGTSNSVLKTELVSEAKYTNAARIAMIIRVVEAYNKLLYVGKKYNKDIPFAIVPKYLEILVANGTLSPEFTNILKEVMPLYPEGTKVMLSDGTTAQVIKYNKNNMLNPSIVDMSGNPIEQTEDLKVAYPLGEIEEYKRLKHL